MGVLEFKLSRVDSFFQGRLHDFNVNYIGFQHPMFAVFSLKNPGRGLVLTVFSLKIPGGGFVLAVFALKNPGRGFVLPCSLSKTARVLSQKL